MLDRVEQLVNKEAWANSAQNLHNEVRRRVLRDLPDVAAALGILLVVLVALLFAPTGTAGSMFVLRVILGVCGALAGSVLAEVLKADIPRPVRAVGAFALFLMIFVANR